MKILFALSRLPYPLDKGDKLRAFYQIRELAKTNDVYLFCLNNKPIHPKAKDILSEFVKDIYIAPFNNTDILKGVMKSFFDKTPLQVGVFSHNKNIKAFKDYCNRIQPDVVFFQFVRMGKYANVPFPKVLDFQDALSANIARRASKSNCFLKPILQLEAKRLSEYEGKMFDIFDRLTIITEADKKEIRHKRQDEIIVLPNGVDASYFEYKKEYQKEYDIIFSGAMSYNPNIVASNFLAKEIMPLVWKKRKDVRLVLAGANPSHSVRNLASENIIVTGWVDDMREYYAKSKIFIAPMQIGTGLQNKLLEAMAMGLPCITSSLANHALMAINNENILIANQAQEYASHIIELLENKSLSDAIAQKGNIFVRENYTWEGANKILEKLFHDIVL